MATTKVVAAIWSGQTLTASSADTTSSAEVIDAGYGAALHIKLTNGATGPTVAAQVQIETSADNTEWYELGGPLIGNTDNNGISSWGDIPIGVGTEYVRLVAGTNTGQNVTVDADISNVTAV